MLASIEEFWGIHRISIQGRLEIILQSHRRFISHLDSILQDTSRELVTRITSEP